MLLVPFILKIFIGMFSDRINLAGLGHRKPYMLIGLVLAASSFGAASFVQPDQNLTLFVACVLLGSSSITLFDSTADGLAIDITPHGEHGTVQGTMVGGRQPPIILSLVFGMVIGGSDGTGYRVVLVLIAASMALPLYWVLRLREPDRIGPAQSFEWGAFRCLREPRFLIFAAYAIIYSIASFGVDGLVSLFSLNNQFNASEALIGQYGALRGVGAVIGAVSGGLLVDRLGRRPCAYLAALAISIGAVLIGISGQAGAVLVMGALWGVAWGFQETIFVALAMDLADARIAASLFAIMMAFSNLGTAAGDGIATALTDNFFFLPGRFPGPGRHQSGRISDLMGAVPSRSGHIKETDQLLRLNGLTMTTTLKLILLGVGTIALLAGFWRTLGKPRRHGFYRLFAFESVLALVVLNGECWFVDLGTGQQILSWILLALSIALALHGFRQLARRGRPAGPLENTTTLVTNGAYHWIRHPLYCSWLLLGWGAFLKSPTWLAALLALVNAGFLTATARVEEREMLVKFGDQYQVYMRRTKMFIPYLF